MKIPGIGEVKPVYAVGGGAIVLGVVGYAYYRDKKTKAAAAAAATTSAAAASGTLAGTGAGDSGIDPATGLPYADEGGDGVGTYGGIDPATGVPYYDEITQSSTTTNPNAITTNQQWIEQAESDGQNLFGATEAVAVSAVGKYISQTTAGLNTSEYSLMQSIVAELGQPPTGGPYRFIQASGTATTGTTAGKTIAQSVGTVVLIPTDITPQNTLARIAAQFKLTTAQILQVNPGVSASSTNVQIVVPYTIKANDSLTSIATQFGISIEHLEQVLQGQGIT
jgi:LysM repeat protein